MGLDDEAIMELMAVVDFFNGSNAVASGLHIPYEPPVYAEQEGVVDGAGLTGQGRPRHGRQ
jgi:hypothetical protein